MTCWHCHRPITVAMKVRNIATDTIPINPNIRVCEQSVRCPNCGSKYIIETYSNGGPTVSKEMLVKLDSIVHP
jgi:transposase-like protein